MELHGASMELHVIPWSFHQMELHGASIEFHDTPWNSMEFHGVPWNSMELFYTGYILMRTHLQNQNTLQPFYCLIATTS